MVWEGGWVFSACKTQQHACRLKAAQVGPVCLDVQPHSGIQMVSCSVLNTMWVCTRHEFLAMGRCMIQDHKPYCNFTLNALSRASGLAQMTRVPQGGSVKFDSCSINMNGAQVSSKTCFQVISPVPVSQETLLSRGSRHSITACASTFNFMTALSSARLASGCSVSLLSPSASAYACITIAALYAITAPPKTSGWGLQQDKSALGQNQQIKDGSSWHFASQHRYICAHCAGEADLQEIYSIETG